MEMEFATLSDEERLQKLGLTVAANRLKKGKALKRKLAVAYEHYRFVRPEKIEEYQTKLRKATLDRRGGYKTLAFTRLEHYGEIPPSATLEALEVAQERGCFDYFEIAHVVKVEDPILFGRVDGCKDRFFVAQWDEDVKIEDILMANEG